jgi:hypothetical protein
MSAEQSGTQWQILSSDERANAQRTLELVRGAAQCRNTEASKIDGQFADYLSRVGMHRDIERRADRCYLGDGLQHTRLVVREHDADQLRVGAKKLAEMIDDNDAPRVNIKVIDFAVRELRGGFENAGVFDLA